MADESTDLLTTEQVSICIRYVRTDGMLVKNTWVAVLSTDANTTMTSAIFEVGR